MSALNDLWDKEVTELSKEIKKLKEDNKRLEKENQALFESINCNDDNMLARRYSNLQKELDKLEDELIEEKQLNVKYIHRLDKKDKIINEMLEWEGTNITLNKCFNCKDETLECNECLKEYFYKKVEEENE